MPLLRVRKLTSLQERRGWLLLLLVCPVAEDWGGSRLAKHTFASRSVGASHQVSEQLNWIGVKIKFWKIDFHEIRRHAVRPFLHTSHFNIIHTNTSPQKEFPWLAVLRIPFKSFTFTSPVPFSIFSSCLLAILLTRSLVGIDELVIKSISDWLTLASGE